MSRYAPVGAKMSLWTQKCPCCLACTPNGPLGPPMGPRCAVGVREAHFTLVPEEGSPRALLCTEQECAKCSERFEAIVCTLASFANTLEYRTSSAVACVIS